MAQRTPPVAVTYWNIKVPQSPFLTEKMIQHLKYGSYEGPEVRGAKYLVRAGETVLEMGTGLGVVSAITAKHCAPARILSFEANPKLIPHIRALYRMNGVEDRVSVRNKVITTDPDAPATLPFHLRASFLSSSLTDRASTIDTVDVPTIQFDQVCKNLSPNVLIMDIEGAELPFLEQADLSELRGIVLEFHPHIYEQEGVQRCQAILTKAGFRQIKHLCTDQVWVVERPHQ